MNSIVEIFQKYNIKLESMGGGKYRTNCPMPDHPDENPSCVVYTDTNSFHCFGCLAHGGPEQFLMKYEGITWNEAIKRLGTGDPVSEIDRLLQPKVVEEQDFNVELNFVSSSLVREKLKSGVPWGTVAQVLKELDQRLTTENLDENAAKQILNKFSQLK